MGRVMIAVIPAPLPGALVTPLVLVVTIVLSLVATLGLCGLIGRHDYLIASADAAFLAPEPGDRVIRKWRPSAFFRTDLEVFLSVQGIDTLIFCGISLSGCVRATVVDAFMRDIRPMIVREGVADRSEAVLEANLFDLEQKYADLVTLDETLRYLARESVPVTH